MKSLYYFLLASALIQTSQGDDFRKHLVSAIRSGKHSSTSVIIDSRTFLSSPSSSTPHCIVIVTHDARSSANHRRLKNILHDPLHSSSSSSSSSRTLLHPRSFTGPLPTTPATPSTTTTFLPNKTILHLLNGDGAHRNHFSSFIAKAQNNYKRTFGGDIPAKELLNQLSGRLYGEHQQISEDAPPILPAGLLVLEGEIYTIDPLGSYHGPFKSGISAAGRLAGVGGKGNGELEKRLVESLVRERRGGNDNANDNDNANAEENWMKCARIGMSCMPTEDDNNDKLNGDGFCIYVIDDDGIWVANPNDSQPSSIKI